MSNVSSLTLAAQETVVEKLSLTASNITGISAGVLLVASSAVAQTGTELQASEPEQLGELQLSEFDQAGLDTDVLALIIANPDGNPSASNTWYADTNRSGADSPDAGELGIGTNQTLISRIRKTNNNTILLNDNDIPQALALRDHFGDPNTDSIWTLHIQTVHGIASSNQLATTGGGYANFVFSGDDIDILDGIEQDTRFIIAITRETIVVEATFSGVSSTLSTTITKTSPGTESINAILSGVGGSLVSEVTKTAPPLELDDFDDTGLIIDAAAIITAAFSTETVGGTSGTSWYRDTNRGGSNVPVEGALGLGTDETVITRIWRAGDRVLLNDNDVNAAGGSAPLTLSSHFGSSDTSDWTLYIQTQNDDGTFNVASSDELISAGGGFVNFRFSTADQTVLDSVADGDRFIIAIAQAAEEQLESVETVISGIGGVLSASITKFSPGTESISATLVGVGGSISSEITKVDPEIAFANEFITIPAWDTATDVNYALPRTTPEPDGVTYTVFSLPNGVTYDSASHSLVGRPGTDDAGLNGTIFLQADLDDQSILAFLYYSVADIAFADDSITIDDWPVDMAVDYDLPRVAGTQTGVTYSISGLPSEVTFNSTNHSLSGTPTTTGTGTATLTATALNSTDSIELVWTVAEAAAELQLSDFDSDGLEVNALALITAEISSNIWYRDDEFDDNSELGVLEDADNDLTDLTLDDDSNTAVIGRIRNTGGGTRILINRNLPDPQPSNLLDLRTHFGTSGGDSPWTLYIQTSAGVATSNQIWSGTTNTQPVTDRYVNFIFSGQNNLDILAGVENDTRFIIAIARRVHAVEAVIAGSSDGGVATANITKTSPGTESVNAVLTGSGGLLSADIGKTSPGTESVNAVLSGTGGSISSTITVEPAHVVTPQLELSDFDTTGLEEPDVLALITASGDGIWYRDTNRNGDDSPTEGQLGLGANNTVITQILKAGNNVVRLNDNDVQADGTDAVLLLSSHFGDSGISNWVLYIQTLDGIASSNQLDGTTGNGYVNFRFSGTANLNILDSIETGTRFIVAVARPEPTPIEAVINGVGGDIAAQITKSSPGTESINAVLTGTSGALSASITKVEAELESVPTLYGVERGGNNRRLWRIDSTSPSDSVSLGDIPQEGDGVQSLNTLVSHAGSLYALQSNKVWRIDLSDPSASVKIADIDPGIPHSDIAAWSHGGLIHVMVRDNIYTLDLDTITNGTITAIALGIDPAPSGNAVGAAIQGGMLYSITTAENLYRNDPANLGSPVDLGHITPITSISLSSGLASLSSSLYFTDDGSLYRIDDPALPATIVTVGAFPTNVRIGALETHGSVLESYTVEAVISGTSGSLSAIITKTEPGTESVEAVLAGTGGVLSAAIAKTSPGTESVNAVIVGTSGSISADITKVEPVVQLELSDFDDDGLTVDAAALITIEDSGNIWYRNDFPNDTDHGDLVAGELGLNGDAETPITSIRLRGSGSRILINNDGHTADLSLRTHFGNNNATSQWTLYVQTDQHVISSNQLANTANRFVNFTFDNAGRDILNALQDGDRVIIAIAQAAEQLESIEAVIQGSPNASIVSQITKSAPGTESVDAILFGTGGSLSSTVTKTSPGTESVTVIITGTAGSVSTRITKTSPGTESVNATLAGTGGSISANVTKVEAFGLSNFDDEGLWVDVKAIITAGSSSDNDWYRPSSNVGTLEDTANSDIWLNGDNVTGTAINRIRYSNNILTLNDADIPTALTLSTHFGSGTSNWTLHIQTRGGVASTDILTGAGNSFARFRFDDPADRTLLAEIDEGDQFIIALTRPIAYVEAVITGGPGLLSAAITKASPGTELVNAVLTGSTGILSSAITKVSPSTESIAAVITGTGGSLVSTITKSSPETKAINAVLVGSSGAIVSNITKDTPANKSVEATLVGTAGSLASADIGTLSIFELSDFNQTGLEIDVLALITASGSATWYADTSRSGSDTVDDGELGLGGTETLISRIRQTNSTTILINDNDIPTAIVLEDHLGITDDNTDTSAWTLYIQTRDGVVSSNSLSSTGGGYANFRFDSADSPILNGITTGTQFIVALARKLHSVEVVFRGVPHSTIAAIGKIGVEDKDVEAVWPVRQVPEAIASVTLGAQEIESERLPLTTTNISGISAGVIVISHGTVAQQSTGLQASIADPIESTASFTAQVTVAEPEDKSVEAVIVGTGGVLTSRISKIGVGTENVEAVLTGVGGALASAELGKIQSLLLSDFDQAGLEIDVLGLITADISADGTWYSDSNFGPLRGTLEDGEIGMGDDETLIARVRRVNDTTILINDRDNPEDLDLNDEDYFGSGATSKRRLYIQTRSGVVFSNQLAGVGESFARFTFTNDDIAVLDSLQTGNRFIIAIATKLHPVEAVITGTGGGLDARITKDTPATKAVNAVLTGVGGALSTADITKEEPGEGNIEAVWPRITGVADTTALSIAAQSIAIEQEAVAASNIEGLRAGVIATTIEDIVHDSSGLRAGVEILVESAGKFIASITKSSPINKPVEAVIAGTGGLLSSVITKTTPGTESVEAVIVGGSDASVVSNITKTTIVNKPVNAVFTGVGGVLTAELDKIQSLMLSDFDKTGLEIDTLALITAEISANGTWYSDDSDSGFGSPRGTVEDGEIGLGDGETLIARVRRTNDTTILVNDRNAPASIELNEHFGPSNGTSQWRLYIQVRSDDDEPLVVSSNDLLSTGGGYANFRFTNDDIAILDRLSTGDRFIIAFARRLHAIETVITGTGGGLDVRITKSAPENKEIESVWPVFEISDSTALTIAAQPVIVEELPLDTSNIDGISAGISVIESNETVYTSSGLKINVPVSLPAGKFIAEIDKETPENKAVTAEIVLGGDARIVTAITKTAPGTESITAVITGIGGELTAIITKIEAGEESVNVVFTGVGGSIVSRVAKDTPADKPVEATIIGVGGAFVSPSIGTIPPGTESITAIWPRIIGVADTTSLVLAAQEIITEELSLEPSNIEGLSAGVAVTVAEDVVQSSIGLRAGVEISIESTASFIASVDILEPANKSVDAVIVGGSESSISSVITKTSPGTETVEAVIVGTSGELAAARITKTAPSTELVEAIITGIGGEIVADITKVGAGEELIEAVWPQPIIVEDTTSLALAVQEVITEELELTGSNITELKAGVSVTVASDIAHDSSGLQIGTNVEAAVGEFIAEVIKRRALVLADFNPDDVLVEDLDPDNLPYEIDALALITAEFVDETVGPVSGTSWYRDTNRSGDNTPTDGELGLGDNETVITRIWRSSNRVLINDNDVNVNDLSAPLSLSSHFGSSGTAQWSLFIQTLDGIISSNQIHTRGTGGGFANFEFIDDDLSILDSVADGDRFIIAVARKVHAIEAVFTGVGGALPSAQITKASPGTESIEFVATGTGGTFAATIDKVAVPVEDVGIVFSGTGGEFIATVDKVEVDIESIEAVWPSLPVVEDTASLALVAHEITTEELPLSDIAGIDISAGVTVEISETGTPYSSGLRIGATQPIESASKFIASIDVVPVGEEAVTFIATGGTGVFIAEISKDTPVNKPVEAVFTGVGGSIIADVATVGVDLFPEALFPNVTFPGSLFPGGHEISGDLLFPDRLFTGTQFPPGLFVEGVEEPEERNIEAVWPPRGVTTSEDAASLAIAARSTVIDELPFAASNITGLKAGVTVTVDNNDIASNSTGLQISTLDLVDNASSFIAEVEKFHPNKSDIPDTPVPPFLVGADGESVQWGWVQPDVVAAKTVKYNFRYRAIDTSITEPIGADIGWMTSKDTTLQSKRIFGTTKTVSCLDMGWGGSPSLDAIVEAIQNAINNAIALITEAFEWATNLLTDAVVLEAITGFLNDMVNNLLSILNRLLGDKDPLDLAALFTAMYAALDEICETLCDQINGTGSSVATAICDSICAALRGVGKILEDAFSISFDGVKILFESIIDSITKLASLAGTILNKIINTIFEAIRDLLNDISTGMAVGVISIDLQAIGDAILAAIKAIGQSMYDALKAIGALFTSDPCEIVEALALDYDGGTKYEAQVQAFTTNAKGQVTGISDWSASSLPIKLGKTSNGDVKVRIPIEGSDLNNGAGIDGAIDAVEVELDALTGERSLKRASDVITSAADPITQSRIPLPNNSDAQHIVFDKNGKAVFVKDGFVVKPESPPITNIPAIKPLPEAIKPEITEEEIATVKADYAADPVNADNPVIAESAIFGELFKPVMRKGDMSAGHGCYPPRPSTGGSSNIFVNHIPVHREGDTWPIHAGPPPCYPHAGTLTTGAQKVQANEKPVAREEDPISCGDMAGQGSPNIFCKGD